MKGRLSEELNGPFKTEVTIATDKQWRSQSCCFQMKKLNSCVQEDRGVGLWSKHCLWARHLNQSVQPHRRQCDEVSVAACFTPTLYSHYLKHIICLYRSWLGPFFFKWQKAVLRLGWVSFSLYVDCSGKIFLFELRCCLTRFSYNFKDRFWNNIHKS